MKPQEALMRGIAAVWGLPMDMWRRLTASLSLLPGDAALAPEQRERAQGQESPAVRSVGAVRRPDAQSATAPL